MSKHRKKQERKILKELKHKVGITRLEVAKLLGIPKTMHVSKICEDMADRGLLVRKHGLQKGLRPIIIYFLNETRVK